MKILIIEDDLNKLQSVKDFLSDFFQRKEFLYDLTIKHSYQSGLESILNETFNLLLLDMSLPNFDIDENNDSGDPLSKGGELILYEMDAMGINLKTIIITQHEDFDGVSLESINSDYKDKFPEIYLNYVFYNSIESNWEIELEQILIGVISD